MWRHQSALVLLLAFLNGVNAAGRHLRRLKSGNETTPVPLGRIRGGFDMDAPFSWLGVFNDTRVCGVVLVHADIVLTSATCVEDTGFPGYVRLGSLDRDTGGTVARIVQGKINPDYNGNPADGADIAVMKLENTLTNTVALMNEDPRVPFDGEDSFFMAGYGKVNDDTYRNNLQGLFLNNVENCFDRAPQFYNPVYHICGDANPANGTCEGDAGIPILIPGTRLVVGLNSFSDGPCTTQTIELYTRMSSYVLWVKKQMCEMSSSPPSFCSEYKSDICLWEEVFNFVTGLFGI